VTICREGRRRRLHATPGQAGETEERG
jgi:hypothetical protein